ncbi:XdhC family protein [Brevibacillus choshinensis]|uniref:XdhC family protein n=1 Tax=Brevibacillus choshinensis TaxID=54911 RepID=A0ABX7FIA4_BRECH|nr:XdhC/CoxI family protein [Brevibacillus choshinensis]QRG65944.1 XdhC family protein [Brevibacillus choshinensis]
MRENEAVLQALVEARKAGKKGVLATVVQIKGSAYRREGAKMFVDETGHHVGLISGGCLEADVAETARTVMEQNMPLIKRYELGEDLVWGLGLGCPGTVDIYLEPVSAVSEWQPAFALWIESLRTGRAAALCTVQPAAGTDSDSANRSRMFLSEDGYAAGCLGDERVNQTVAAWASELFHEQSPKSESRSLTLEDGTTVNLFVDISVPAPAVMIFGAGHDAVPVARLSASLGFPTTVIDPRPAYNTVDRFPQATRILTEPSQYREKVMIDKRTYVIIMNHHLERDREALKYVLSTPAPYVGLLGPRSRANRILEGLGEEGCLFGDRQLERLFSPIGHDIGAESAEEIAVSILAEIIAMRSGHEGGRLRDKARIHRIPVTAR